MIEPIVLKGFRDSLPEQEITKKRIMRLLEDQFSSFGFVPIDTPTLEYTSVLLGKGGGETDKQIFRFEDNGKRDVALRFDLTVPFARFLATHREKIALPFKRFHISKAYRGENPQKGRYREFIQCDFDIVGVDNAEADFEILILMSSSFEKMGLSNYQFHIAHRGMFNSFLTHLEIQDKNVEILRAVDKLRKIGEEKVLEILVTELNDENKAKLVLQYINADEKDDFLARIEKLEALSGGENESSVRMKTIYALLKEYGIEKSFILDPSITRGLDYYTGIVYETFLTDLPNFGSVCSGGRYNDLASLYTKEQIPGVGSSIGLDRLMAALEELNSPIIKNTKSADIAIFHSEEDTAKAFLSAKAIREAGFAVSVFLDPKKKFKAQMNWAEKNNISFSVTFSETGYTLKNLETREITNTEKLEEVINCLQ